MVNSHPHCSNFFFMVNSHPLLFIFTMVNSHPIALFMVNSHPLLFIFTMVNSHPHCSIFLFFFIFMVNSHPLLFIFTMVNSHPIALFRGELSPILTVPGEHLPHCLYNTYTFCHSKVKFDTILQLLFCFGKFSTFYRNVKQLPAVRRR